jgi:hypothetical protein
MLESRQLGQNPQIIYLPSRYVMLVERLKYVIAGPLVGLLLVLPVSGTAVACGRSHNHHVTKAASLRSVGEVARLTRRYAPASKGSVPKASSRVTSPVRAVTHSAASAPGPLRQNELTLRPRASVQGAPPRSASFHQVSVRDLRSTLRSSSSKSCDHPRGCSCCSDNGGCCGMACCTAALPASEPTSPDTHRHAWAEPTFRPSHAVNSDALFRPPC